MQHVYLLARSSAVYRISCGEWRSDLLIVAGLTGVVE